MKWFGWVAQDEKIMEKNEKKTLWVFIIHFTWSFYQAWTFFSEEWCFCNYVDLMPPSDCRFNRSIKTFHIITQNLNISLLHKGKKREKENISSLFFEENWHKADKSLTKQSRHFTRFAYNNHSGFPALQVYLLRQLWNLTKEGIFIKSQIQLLQNFFKKYFSAIEFIQFSIHLYWT